MIRHWHTLIGIVIAGVMLTGCATIVNHDYQDVPVTSQPSGLRVLLDEHSCGVTPVIVTLARGERHTVTIEQKGYNPYQIRLEPTLSPFIFGNIVFGGLIGLGLDAIMGGIYEYRIGQIHAFFPVALQEQPSTAPLPVSEPMATAVVTDASARIMRECDPYARHPASVRVATETPQIRVGSHATQ